MKKERRGQPGLKHEARPRVFLDTNSGRLEVTQKEIDVLIQGVLNLCTLRSSPKDRDFPLRAMFQDLNKELMLGELALMRVCAAVYIIKAFFRPTFQAEIQSALDRLLPAALADCGDDRMKSQPEKAMQEFNRRFPMYVEALPLPNPLGAAGNAGKVFAKLVGRESDKIVPMLAFTEFQGVFMATKRLLEEFDAKSGGKLLNPE